MTDAELIEFATAFREGVIGDKPSGGFCFMVCAPLSGLLHAHGVEAELNEGGPEHINHFWLELSDGRVLDPTADQFGILPPVYLGPRTEIHSYETI